MALPINHKQVAKTLSEVLPEAEEDGNWVSSEGAARCLRALGRHEEATRWFLQAARAVLVVQQKTGDYTDFLRAANYYRLAGQPELGRPYLEQAIPMIAIACDKMTNTTIGPDAMAECLFLLGDLEAAARWAGEVRRRRGRSKTVLIPELPGYVWRARQEQNPEAIREALALVEDWVRRERLKPWVTGFPIHHYDWHEILEQELALLA